MTDYLTADRGTLQAYARLVLATFGYYDRSAFDQGMVTDVKQTTRTHKVLDQNGLLEYLLNAPSNEQLIALARTVVQHNQAATQQIGEWFVPPAEPSHAARRIASERVEHIRTEDPDFGPDEPYTGTTLLDLSKWVLKPWLTKRQSWEDAHRAAAGLKLQPIGETAHPNLTGDGLFHHRQKLLGEHRKSLAAA